METPEPPSLAVRAAGGARGSLPSAALTSLARPESARRATREPHPPARPEHSPESAPYRRPASPPPSAAGPAGPLWPEQRAGARCEHGLGSRICSASRGHSRPQPATAACVRTPGLDSIRWQLATTKKPTPQCSPTYRGPG